MSLLDTDNLDVYLAPYELLKNYGIGIQTNLLSQASGEKQTYSKGYLFTNKGTQAFIEVWYPGSKYYGTLWRYAGYPLKQNLVYVQYLDHPNSDWSARSEACFYGLNLGEFDILYKAVKQMDFDTIYELQDFKPFIPEIVTFH